MRILEGEASQILIGQIIFDPIVIIIFILFYLVHCTVFTKYHRLKG